MFHWQPTNCLIIQNFNYTIIQLYRIIILCDTIWFPFLDNEFCLKTGLKWKKWFISVQIQYEWHFWKSVQKFQKTSPNPFKNRKISFFRDDILGVLIYPFFNKSYWRGYTQSPKPLNFVSQTFEILVSPL